MLVQQVSTTRTVVEKDELEVPHVDSSFSMGTKYLQAFLVVLTGLHCFAYFQKHGLKTTPTISDLWVLGTGPQLLFFLLLEVAMGVAVEGGHPWRLRSWVRFFMPLYRKLEVLFLAFVIYRTGRSLVLHVMYQGADLEQTEEAETVRSMQYSDELTVTVIVLYRAVRLWGIYYGVSTMATEEFRRQQGDPTNLWMKEQTIHIQKHNQRPIVRLEKLIDTPPFQAFMLVVVCVPVFCYYASRKGIGQRIYQYARPLGYVCSVLVFLDFCVHCLAQGGERFFIPKLQQCEAALLSFSLLMMVYATWNHQAIEEDRASFVPSAQVIIFGLIAHRCLHIIGLHYGVSGSQWSSKTILNAQTHRIFTSLFGDLLEVPPSNVKTAVGDGFEFQMSKARVRHEAFEGLHLPLSVRGGLLEDLRIAMPRPDEAHERSKKEATVLKAQNLLLVLGPGDGLAEAGDIGNDTPPQYWDYENVLEAKSRLVELISRRLRPARQARREGDDLHSKSTTHGTQRQGKTATGGIAGAAGRKDKLLNRLKNHAASMAQETSLRQLAIEITSVTVQFEDPSGQLGFGALTVGASLGKVWIHRLKDKYVKCDVLRLGVYVEDGKEPPGEAAGECDKADGGRDSGLEPKDRSDGSLGTDSRRGNLGQLLRSDPQLAVRELQRIMNLERLRVWPLDITDAAESFRTDQGRHSLSERWQEQRWIFRLVRLKIRSVPLGGVTAGQRNGGVRPAHTQVGFHEGRKTLCHTFYNFALWICRLFRSSVKAIVATEEDESTGRTAAEREDEPDWEWEVLLRPVQLSIDDRQARCLTTLETCLKRWLLLDAALRWRPEPPSQRPPKNSAEPEELDPHLRGTTARLWWIYAVRRVLAQRQMALKVPLQDLIMKVHAKVTYQALLSEVLQRGSKNNKGLEWEQRWLKELQMRLAIGDIVGCRRLALAQAPAADDEDEQEEGSRMAIHFNRLSKRFSSGSLHDAWEDNEEEARLKREASLVKVPTSSSTTVDESKGFRHKVLEAASGHWKLMAPRIDVRVMRGGPPPRSVVLHMGMSGIVVDALFMALPAFDAERLMPTNSSRLCAISADNAHEATFALTIDGFRASCPDAGPLLPGDFGKHILTVTRQLRPPPPRPGHLGFGSQPVALALRAALPSIASGLPGLLELHAPDMRVVVYPSLLRWLQTLRSPDGAALDAWGSGQEVDTVHCNQQVSKLKDKRLCREMLPRHMLELDGVRVERAAEKAIRRSARFMQWLFEALTGVHEERPDWLATVSVGEVRAVQVGEYCARSRNKLLVQRCHIAPFSYDGTRKGDQQLRANTTNVVRGPLFNGSSCRPALEQHSFQLGGSALTRLPNGSSERADLSKRDPKAIRYWHERSLLVEDDTPVGPPQVESPQLSVLQGVGSPARGRGWCACAMREAAEVRGPQAGSLVEEGQNFLPRMPVPDVFLDLARGSSVVNAGPGYGPSTVVGGDGGMHVEVQLTIVPVSASPAPPKPEKARRSRHLSGKICSL